MLDLNKLITLYKLNIKQIENIKIILQECALQSIFDLHQVSYILATVKHETANTFAPIKEIGGISYFIRKYWTNSKVARWLGNDNANDAAKYYGRGHIQLTGEANYEKFSKIFKIDLVNKPNLALDPVISAKILVYGMKYGSFTGLGLNTFFNSKTVNPVLARRIVNGNDKANLIATYYKEILNSLI